MSEAVRKLKLSVIPATAQDLAELHDDVAAFERRHGLVVVDGYTEFPDALQNAREMLEAGTVDAEWWTHLFIDENNRLIGLGGYAGNPNDAGVIEIGYGVAPKVRGQGYATNSVKLLVSKAFSNPAVKEIIAHTLAEEDPSTRVLEKNGFTKVEDLEDPQEGPIWRWSLKK
ncbi:MAG: GNAT family protein [Gammaproteobacteria bacterium]|nr:GNAT family protein [Gammaproteobacteria bacterium]